MREYEVNCWTCQKIIKIKMKNEDKRRSENGFFKITCQHCKKEFYAKIFEKLVIYPFMLERKGE